jgi:serine/threonine protein kinase
MMSSSIKHDMNKRSVVKSKYEKEFEEWCHTIVTSHFISKQDVLAEFITEKDLKTSKFDPPEYPGLHHAAAYALGHSLGPAKYNFDALDESSQMTVMKAMNEKFYEADMGTRFKPNKRINHWGIVSKLGTGGSFNRGIFLVDDLNDLLETRQGIMKVLPSHALDPDYAQREISILAPLRHNNIVQLYDSYMPEQPKHPHATPWMVTEYCDKGTLKDLVRNTNKAGGKLPECFLWQVFESLARAVHYCHNGPIYGKRQWLHKVAHRDIILDNIFLKRNGDPEYDWESFLTVKLGDWGCAVSPSEWDEAGGDESKFPPIESEFEPPEGAPATEAVDVYQIGVVMQCLYTMMSEPVQNGKPAAKIEVRSSTSTYSMELFELIKTCLVDNPEDRPCARDVELSVQVERASLLESGELSTEIIT